MNKRKGIIIALTIFLIIIGILFFLFMSRETFTFSLPISEDLVSISISNKTTQKEITDKTEIKDIVNRLEGNGRTTKKESINDSPVNVEDPIKLEFYFENTGTSVIYMYIKDDRYYIEQPYNGIYQITYDEYNSIAKYVI